MSTFVKFPNSFISQMNQTGERVEKPRPITVADLEARPGSPSVVIVPGSVQGSGSNTASTTSRGRVNITNIVFPSGVGITFSLFSLLKK